jgi:hypothetical protein
MYALQYKAEVVLASSQMLSELVHGTLDQIATAALAVAASIYHLLNHLLLLLLLLRMAFA